MTDNYGDVPPLRIVFENDGKSCEFGAGLTAVVSNRDEVGGRIIDSIELINAALTSANPNNKNLVPVSARCKYYVGVTRCKAGRDKCPFYAGYNDDSSLDEEAFCQNPIKVTGFLDKQKKA